MGTRRLAIEVVSTFNSAGFRQAEAAAMRAAQAMNSIPGLFSQLAAAGAAKIRTLGASFGSLGELVERAAGSIGKALAGLNVHFGRLGALWDSGSKSAGASVSQIGSAFAGLPRLIGPAFAGIALVGTVALGGLLSLVGNLVQSIGTGLVNALTAAAHVAGQVGSTLAQAFQSVAQQGIQVNSLFESVRAGLATMLKSPSLGGDFLRVLRTEAKSSAFEFTQLAESAQSFLSFGFRVQEIIPALRTLGDTAFARGSSGAVERFQQLIRAVGQIKSKGILQGDEALQLQEAGVNVRDLLKIPAGADIGRLNISADVAIPQILAGMKQSFGGLQQQMMSTLPGILSNLSDSWNDLTANVTGGFYESWKRTLQAVQGLFNSTGGQQIAAGIGRAFDLAGAMMERLASGLPGLTAMLGDFFASGSWEAWLQGAARIFDQIVAAAGKAFQWLQANWSTIWDTVSGLALNAFRLVSGGIGGVLNLVRHFGQAIEQSGGFWVTFGTVAKTVLLGVLDLMSGVLRAVLNVGNLLNPIADALEKAAQFDAAKTTRALAASLQSGLNVGLDSLFDPQRNLVKSIDFGNMAKSAADAAKATFGNILGSVGDSPFGQLFGQGFQQGVAWFDDFRNGALSRGGGTVIPDRAAGPAGTGNLPNQPVKPSDVQQQALNGLNRQLGLLKSGLELQEALGGAARAYAESVGFAGQSAAAVEGSLRAQLALQLQTLQAQQGVLALQDPSTAIGQQAWADAAVNVGKTYGEVLRLQEALRQLPIQVLTQSLNRIQAQGEAFGAAADQARQYAAILGNTPEAIAAAIPAMQAQLASLRSLEAAQNRMLTLQPQGTQEWWNAAAAVTRTYTEASKLAETIRLMPVQAAADHLASQVSTWSTIVETARAHNATLTDQGAATRNTLTLMRGHLQALEQQRGALTRLLALQRPFGDDWLKTVANVHQVTRGIEDARSAMRDLVFDTSRLSQGIDNLGKSLSILQDVGAGREVLQSIAAQQVNLLERTIALERSRLATINQGTDAYLKQQGTVLGFVGQYAGLLKQVFGAGPALAGYMERVIRWGLNPPHRDLPMPPQAVPPGAYTMPAPTYPYATARSSGQPDNVSFPINVSISNVTVNDLNAIRAEARKQAVAAADAAVDEFARKVIASKQAQGGRG